jgi:hypothetical protein
MNRPHRHSPPSRRLRTRPCGVIAGLALAAVASVAAAPPIPVSPGAADRALAISDSCPTFSWTAAGEQVEIALFHIARGADGLDDAAAVGRLALPPGASSWTPPAEHCLARGERYAWTLRLASALDHSITGYLNTAVGQSAMTATLGGFRNTAVGAYALDSNTSGTRNVALGHRAGYNATTGSYNIFIGHPGVAGDDDKIRIGVQGTQTATYVAGIYGNPLTGSPVVVDASGMLGVGAAGGIDADTLDGLDSTDFLLTGTDLWVNESGDTMTGDLTLDSGVDLNLGGSIRKGGTLFLHNEGSANTGVGIYALGSTTTGNSNTGVGALALEYNTAGSANAALGRQALRNNLSGGDNSAVGSLALLEGNTSGDDNTAVGHRALYKNSNANAHLNTALGNLALYSNTEGAENTALGQRALYSNSTGSYNIGVGRRAGYDSTTGDFNILIGNTGVAAEAYTTRIGSVQTKAFMAGVYVGSTNHAVYVDDNGQLGQLASSRRFKEEIVDIEGRSEALLELRPVKFRYRDRRPVRRAKRRHGRYEMSERRTEGGTT